MPRPVGPAPRWADTLAGYDSPGNPWDNTMVRVTPPTGKLDNGYEPDEQPSPQFMNYQLGRSADWLQYLDGVEARNTVRISHQFDPINNDLVEGGSTHKISQLQCVAWDNTTKVLFGFWTHDPWSAGPHDDAFILGSADGGHTWQTVSPTPAGDALTVTAYPDVAHSATAGNWVSIADLYMSGVQRDGEGIQAYHAASGHLIGIDLRAAGPFGAEIANAVVCADPYRGVFWCGGKSGSGATYYPAIGYVTVTGPTTATYSTPYFALAPPVEGVTCMAVSNDYILALTGSGLRLRATSIGSGFASQTGGAAVGAPYPRALAYGAADGLFMLITLQTATIKVWTSGDGAVWTQRAALGAIPIGHLRCIGSIWQIPCVNATFQRVLATSRDQGVTWTYDAQPVNFPVVKAFVVDTRLMLCGGNKLFGTAGAYTLASTLRPGS